MTASEMLGNPEKTAGKMAEKHLFFFPSENAELNWSL